MKNLILMVLIVLPLVSNAQQLSVEDELKLKLIAIERLMGTSDPKSKGDENPFNIIENYNYSVSMQVVNELKVYYRWFKYRCGTIVLSSDNDLETCDDIFVLGINENLTEQNRVRRGVVIEKINREYEKLKAIVNQ